jgi:hypothetical protein
MKKIFEEPTIEVVEFVSEVVTDNDTDVTGSITFD